MQSCLSKLDFGTCPLKEQRFPREMLASRLNHSRYTETFALSSFFRYFIKSQEYNLVMNENNIEQPFESSKQSWKHSMCFWPLSEALTDPRHPVQPGGRAACRTDPDGGIGVCVRPVVFHRKNPSLLAHIISRIRPRRQPRKLLARNPFAPHQKKHRQPPRHPPSPHRPPPLQQAGKRRSRLSG